MPLNNYHIIESTLREGEQFSTATFNTAQKLEIAGMLDDFGVEMIEMTTPVASPQSEADIRAVVGTGLNARILTHIRCNRDDALRALRHRRTRVGHRDRHLTAAHPARAWQEHLPDHRPRQ